jgi:hypothetical protein
MISVSVGTVWGVQSVRHRDISALMISEPLVAVWGVQSMRHP